MNAEGVFIGREPCLEFCLSLPLSHVSLTTVLAFQATEARIHSRFPHWIQQVRGLLLVEPNNDGFSGQHTHSHRAKMLK